MGESRKVPASVLRVCRDHVEDSPDVTAIYWFPMADDPEQVRILEVDASAGLQIDEVVPFHFAATGDYPSVIIAVILPSELEKVRAGLIPLPGGWGCLEDAVEVDLSPFRTVAA